MIHHPFELHGTFIIHHFGQKSEIDNRKIELNSKKKPAHR